MENFGKQFQELNAGCAYDRGMNDAREGKASADMIFSSTQEHNDYILGLQAGIAESQKNERRARSPKIQIQSDMFGGMYYDHTT